MTFVANAVEQVGLDKVDTVCEVVAGCVFAGDVQRRGRDVGGCDVCVRQMMRERERDGAGTRADVEDARLFL